MVVDDTIGQGRFEGWRVFAVLSTAVVVMALVILALIGTDTDGYRMVIRATARTSLVLFLAAFTATAVHRLWPGDRTAWTLRNRRYLALSFAASHGVHLIAIALLAGTDADTFAALTGIGSFVGGGLGYLVILTLVATSFDRVVAVIGPGRWRPIEVGGTWFIWVLFTLSNGGRIAANVWYAIPTAALVGAVIVKVAARRQLVSTA